MLDRHAVQELVRARVTAHAIAKQFGVSVRTVRRIVREVAAESGDDPTARAARRIGRPPGGGEQEFGDVHRQKKRRAFSDVVWATSSGDRPSALATVMRTSGR